MKLKLFSIAYLVSLWLTSISPQENKLKQNGIDEDCDDSPRFFQVNVNGGLVLREKPDRNSKKIDILSYAKTGNILCQTRKTEVIDGKEGRWFEVEYKGTLGWIFSGYTNIEFDSAIFMEMEDEFFLIKTKNPILFSKPGGIPLKRNNDYPVENEFVRIQKKKRFRGKEYLYFKMHHIKNKTKIIKGWILPTDGILMSPNQFSEYTLKLRRKKFSTEQKQILKDIADIFGADAQIILNYRDIQFLPLKLKRGVIQKKDIILVRVSLSNKTSKDYGDYQIENHIVSKESNRYKIETVYGFDRVKIFDLDNDGIPEIYAEFVKSGQPSTCVLFGYELETKEYRETIPVEDRYCRDIKIKANGTIEIKQDKELTFYKFEKNILKEIRQK